MDELNKKYYKEAEKDYSYVEENYTEDSRATYDDNSDILLLILAELKKLNNNINKQNNEEQK